MMFFQPKTSLRIWLMISIFLDLAEAVCFDSFGFSLSSNWSECGTLSDWSICCYLEETCMDNGLCLTADGRLGTSTCDNPEWDGCVNMCPSTLWVADYVEQCTPTQYCCLDDTLSCCTNSSSTHFEVSNSPLSDTTSASTTASTGTALSSSSSSLADSLSSSSASSSTSSSTSTISVTSTSTSTATSSSDSKPVPVGAIVGGVIGGLAILAVAICGLFWMFLRHRQSQFNAQDQSAAMQHNFTGSQQYYGGHGPPAKNDMAGTTWSGMETRPDMGSDIQTALVNPNYGQKWEGHHSRGVEAQQS